MNRLSRKRRAAIVACLVEGNSVRSTCRLTGAAKKTVLRLLVDLGRASILLHDRHVRAVRADRVQVDEVWCFVGMKDANIPDDRKGEPHLGSVWTWVALDADTKLVLSWYVGERTVEAAVRFLQDLRARIATRIQLSSDGFYGYMEAVRKVFAFDVDYGQVQKIYGPGEGENGRHSQCIGSQKVMMIGRPVIDDISTSLIERQNLTMRMSMRRYTRRTNAYSKKLLNLRAAVALNYAYYNFCRVHHTIRVTPAMEAGVADRVWEIEDLVAFLEAQESK